MVVPSNQSSTELRWNRQTAKNANPFWDYLHRQSALLHLVDFLFGGLGHVLQAGSTRGEVQPSHL